MLVHVDLFSGTGGFALACEWAGIPTICFVEIDKYCQKVLRKHWPDVPIVEDIRDVKGIKEIVINASGKGCLAEQSETGIPEQALQETPSGKSGRADSLSGIGRGTASMPKQPTILATAGFPCQPFSVAGKRGGEKDDRYLWPETLGVIEAIKPTWILLENVTGIINLALDTVLSDLEGAGYSTETLIIPACAVNAPHRRDRVWIVAHSKSSGNARGPAEIRRPKRRQGASLPVESDKPSAMANNNQVRCGGWPSNKDSQAPKRSKAVSVCNDVPNTQREGLEGADAEGDSCRTGQPGEHGQRGRQADWWAVEPNVGRVAHGIPRRVDRLKCLGNAIVPQVAYQIIKVIKELAMTRGIPNG